MAKISIYGDNGSIYTYEEETGFITKNDVIVPSSMAQPVFIQPADEKTPPQLTGLWLRNENKIICRSGRINPLIDSKQIKI